jgi:hypothetical protein
VVGCLQLLDDGTSEVGRLVVAAHVRRPVSAVHVSSPYSQLILSLSLPLFDPSSPQNDTLLLSALSLSLPL